MGAMMEEDLYPDAVEVCDDGVDNNCNQALDCADSDCASDGACVELTVQMV